MKVGSTVYVTNTVLYNLIYKKDQWDELVDRWCAVSWNLWAFFGVITRNVTNIVRRMTLNVYKFVQKGYMKLSKRMEFEADAVSCKYIGSNNFISAMCKVEVLAERDSRYQSYLKLLADDNKIVGNYFVGLSDVEKTVPAAEHVDLQYDKPLKEPVFAIKRSRLNMDNVWDSHPSLESRLENAASYPDKPVAKAVPAWDMIPESVRNKVSDQMLSVIRMTEDHKVDTIDENEFVSWAKGVSDYNTMPSHLKPFFDRRIQNFDYTKIDTKAIVDNPFTKENADFLNQFDTEIDDYQKMCGIANGQIEAENITFDGKVYNKKNLPIEKEKAKLTLNIVKARKIDQDVYLYLLSKCDEKQAENLQFYYHTMFYSYWMQDGNIQKLASYRDAIYAMLTKATILNEENYDNLCFEVSKYETFLQNVARDSNPQCMSLIVDEETMQRIGNFVNKELHVSSNLKDEYINFLFNMTDSLIQIHQKLLDTSRKMIVGIAKEVV